MDKPQLPSFANLLKSREVEDPVNVMIHRPLAYGFVWLVFRTAMTPNQVTLLATAIGAAAGGMWLWGTPLGMVAGGLLLWASAILDGADGILARAKGLQSDFGRALDGAADGVVALSTVLPAFYHLMLGVGFAPLYYVVGVLAVVSALVHVTMYDFYKESYLRMTRLERGGEGSDEAVVRARFAEAKGSLGLVTRLAVRYALLPRLSHERYLVGWSNPEALREGQALPRTEASARIFRRHNAGPMRLWALVSLAPHSYLLAICAMFDRVDIYLWIRVLMMNAAFVAALLWQRRATRRTLRELSEEGILALPTAQCV